MRQNPLTDISAIERIQIVVQAGRIVYKAGTKQLPGG
jgi:hypothetical protein